MPEWKTTWINSIQYDDKYYQFKLNILNYTDLLLKELNITAQNRDVGIFDMYVTEI